MVRPAAGAGLHQVAGDLGLAVDGDGLAARVVLEIEAVQRAVEGDVDTFVDKPLGVNAGPCPGLIEQIDGALLEHASADAAQHVFGRTALDDDVVDASAAEELTQEQPRGTGADDGDLGAHHALPSRVIWAASARAVRSEAAVVIAIGGRINHSSVQAAPERSCSWTSASCMPPTSVAL